MIKRKPTPIESIGGFEQVVLSAVLLLGKDAYGMTVHQTVEEFGKRCSLGAVYTTLDRLEKKGLVSSWYSDPTPERGGRSKRYFKVEAAGQEALESSLDRAASIATALRAAGALV